MSEAELDKALGYMTMVWDESGIFGQPPDYSHIYLTGKQEAKEAILDLIRTEKLKLLAEVREQTTIFKIKSHDKKGQPHLYEAGRGVPTEALTKLEAEL